MSCSWDLVHAPAWCSAAAPMLCASCWPCSRLQQLSQSKLMILLLPAHSQVRFLAAGYPQPEHSLFWMWYDLRPHRLHMVCVLLRRLPAGGLRGPGEG